MCSSDLVVVTGEYHRSVRGDQLGGMSQQAAQPAQLVIELRTRRGVAVRQVQTADEQTAHVRLDVADVHVIRITGQRAPDFRRLAAAREDAKLVLARDPKLTSPRGAALRQLLYLFARDEAIRLLGAG